MIELTVSTFNGLTVKSTGYTLPHAKAEAWEKCDAMGTSLKRIVSVLEIKPGSSDLNQLEKNPSAKGE
jgi:hypothetical protein